MKLFLTLSLLAAGCEAGRASKARVAGVVEKRQEKATYKAYTIDQPVYSPLSQLFIYCEDILYDLSSRVLFVSLHETPNVA